MSAPKKSKASKDSETYGTEEIDYSRLPLSRDLAHEISIQLEMTGQGCDALNDDTLAVAVAALLDVLARRHWHIHPSVPVCTNCREKVEAVAWDAMAHLDGPLTEQAAAMIVKSKAGAKPFKDSLEERGVKP